MTAPVYHTPLLSIQRAGSKTAAANLIRGLIPAQPRPDWDGALWLKTLPADLPFPTPKNPKIRRKANGPNTVHTLRDGRGIVFQCDHSALIVAQEGDAWRVLPAPVGLVNQLFDAERTIHRPKQPPAGPRLIARATGPLSINITEGSDPHLTAGYADALFAAVDTLLAHPTWSLPMGDVRLLDPHATQLPEGRIYPSWGNWEGPSPQDTDDIQAFLSLLGDWIFAAIAPTLSHRLEGVGVSLRFTTARNTKLGNCAVSIQGVFARGPRNPGEDAALKDALDPYRAAIKPWFKGPQFWLPNAARHPRSALSISGHSGWGKLHSAHAMLAHHARIQDALADLRPILPQP